MTVVCPTCGKDDTIQKISAVYSAGRTSGMFSGPTGGVSYTGGRWGGYGGFMTLSGHTSTDLSRILAPPQKPSPPRGDWRITGCWALVLIFSFPILSYGGIGILGLLLSTEGSDTTSLAKVMALAAIIWALFLVIGIKRSRRWHSANKAQMQKAYVVAKGSWDKAMEFWESAYYCFRDDIVFAPSTGRAVSSSDLNELLYPDIS